MASEDLPENIPAPAGPGLDLKGLQAIVFDFDGTLAELNIDFVEMRRLVSELAGGFGFDLESTGQPYVLEAVGELARSHGPKGDAFAAQALNLIETLELEAADRGRLFPGVREGLGRLSALGLKLAIITRNCRAAVKRVFPDLAAWCDHFLPREEAPKPKPAPEHLTLALERLNIRPERSLMVGDHPIDVATARRAGAWACGLTTGRMNAQDLAEADLVLSSLKELVDLVAGTGR